MRMHDSTPGPGRHGRHDHRRPHPSRPRGHQRHDQRPAGAGRRAPVRRPRHRRRQPARDQPRAGARNASALQYHFGDRDGLLRAVLAKHQHAVEARRHAMLDAYEADGGADLRALAGALVRPSAAMLADGDGGPAYLQIVADLMNRPRPGHRPCGPRRPRLQRVPLAHAGRRPARQRRHPAAPPVRGPAVRRRRAGPAGPRRAPHRRPTVRQPPRRPGRRVAGRPPVRRDPPPRRRARRAPAVGSDPTTRVRRPAPQEADPPWPSTSPSRPSSRTLRADRSATFVDDVVKPGEARHRRARRDRARRVHQGHHRDAQGRRRRRASGCRTCPRSGAAWASATSSWPWCRPRRPSRASARASSTARRPTRATCTRCCTGAPTSRRRSYLAPAVRGPWPRAASP